MRWRRRSVILSIRSSCTSSGLVARLAPLLPEAVPALPYAQLGRILAVVDSLDQAINFGLDSDHNGCVQRAYIIRNALIQAGVDCWLVFNTPSQGNVYLTIAGRDQWYDHRSEWGHHAVPILKIQQPNGSIQTQVLDVHFGALPQSLADWLAFQNDPASTWYVVTGAYCCTLDALIDHNCQQPSTPMMVDSFYADCLAGGAIVTPQNGTILAIGKSIQIAPKVTYPYTQWLQ